MRILSVVGFVISISAIFSGCGGAKDGAAVKSIRGSDNAPTIAAPAVLTGNLKPLKFHFLRINCDAARSDCLQYVTVHDGDVIKVPPPGPIQAGFVVDAADNPPAPYQAVALWTLPPGNADVERFAYCVDYGEGNDQSRCTGAMIGYTDRVAEGNLGLDSIPIGSYRVSITYADGATRSLAFAVAP